MGFRFRRSTKFGPIRITASTGGIGISAGVKGARIGVGADGRARGTVGIPGSGMSYQHTLSGPRSAQGAHYAPSSGIPWKGLLIGFGIAGALGVLGIGALVALLAYSAR